MLWYDIAAGPDCCLPGIPPAPHSRLWIPAFGGIGILDYAAMSPTANRQAVWPCVQRRRGRSSQGQGGPAPVLKADQTPAADG